MLRLRLLDFLLFLAGSSVLPRRVVFSPLLLLLRLEFSGRSDEAIVVDGIGNGIGKAADGGNEEDGADAEDGGTGNADERTDEEGAGFLEGEGCKVGTTWATGCTG